MTESQRNAIAYIVCKLMMHKEPEALYSYEQAEYVRLSGTVDPNTVDIFDYDRDNYICGNMGAKYLELYDYETCTQCDLHLSGDSFFGYDHGQMHAFNGFIHHDHISLYDFGVGRYYDYAT